MAGLLLLGLLACAPVASTEIPLLILSELCYYPLNMDYIDQELGNFSLKILPPEDVCEDPSKLLHILSTSRAPLLGSLSSEFCSPAYIIANFYNTTLVTWNCPKTTRGIDTTRDLRLAPSIPTITRGFAKVVANMKWKSVAIVASNTSPLQPADAVDHCRTEHASVWGVYSNMLTRKVAISGDGWWPSLSQSIDIQLREFGIIPRHFFMIGRNSSRRHLENKLRILKRISCRAVITCLAADEAGKTVLEVIDNLQLAHDHNTLTVFMDVSNLLSWKYALAQKNATEAGNGTNFLDAVSSVSKKCILIYSEADNASLESAVLRNVHKSIARLGGLQEQQEAFLLSGLHEDGAFRPLLAVSRDNASEFVVAEVADNLEEWMLKHKQLDECEGCESELAKTLSVLGILGCSCLFVTVLLGTVALARSQLLKKRVSKGPYKVLLTATDFVFPQIADSRRVDEGIEAMLCCWLQQLQEFGGPEVDKPDLLQGSGASVKTPLRGGSSPNLAKQLIVDPRVRYNGDLVQMKPVPSAGGTVELKAKTVELLVLLHGLRHENLNPLIGCLAEPPRAALVSEYCARGSLQDVLQQDDIKLDWSFRLSLLTDLVRGMKYLHSTPIRVHGYLTSRNCVIDARWVLKVTDYGLPAFYEAQGMQPPAKTARELLWTAPELLRHASLRKKGTQPGDVYSFGIVLQEVVVRGEPFCMLALTPEEIIEKVKRPPPLIRPSVSKGAAPPEAINIMRQCWAEQAEMRPDFNTVHDQFKKLNHGRKVNIVDTMFQMLEKYSNNLEELIRERTEQLDIEKKKTEQLLNRMLPSSVAEKLKLGMPVDPEEFEEVTIYFSDIVGFTTISAHSTPFQVVDLLNDLYTCFDATINAYNVYKVETIGDAYMVVGGLPVRVPDHAEQIATMALDLLHQSGRFRITHLPGTPLRLRIGLHTGPCCAGVVGLTMPRYCLFGDTVNTASRMESTGAAWRIHLSEATKERLEKAGGYQLEYRGPTEIKGKGTMHTYWLLGKAGFDKPLPVPPSLELDESLIISKSISGNLKHEETTTSGDSISVESRQQPFSEDHQPKSPNPNPSFIKTMETSKFSSLVKTQDETATMRHDYHMVKSTSSDTPMSLGTPVSATEVAAALLGASTSSLCGFRRHRKIEEEDLSTPYNHYKCLSPKHRIGKLLRRQFSLDRTEEIRTEESLQTSPRLFKQNSAGAADLEKIEEVPMKLPVSPAPSTTPLQCTLSISADSLIH
ncbi:Retinal guanylyl cyclase 2-like Protein [Tribolium castaneum]|uniref:Guanylate cyclase n=1 Tax=Tribolium castaneum TaxID=7070 RepID=A0A139WIM2_TRICA|nr:Retinal guanylyl cyclase 2-like Protein [Tribolium castaneum]